MRKYVKNVLSVIIGAALMSTAVTAAVPFSAYAEGTSESGAGTPEGLTLSPVVLNYSLTNSKGKAVTELTADSPFNMKMTIKDIKVKTSAIGGAADIDFIKSMDSFKGTVESVTITSRGDESSGDESSGDELLQYVVSLKDCKWTGGDTSFGFMVGYTGGSEYATGSVSLPECKTSESSGGSDSVIAEPTIKVTGVEPSAPIKAGETGEFKIKLKNLSANSAYNILAEISPSDDILIVEGTGTQDIYELDCKEEEILTIKYKALDKINSERQNFSVTLKYYYDNGMNEALGSSSTQVAVAAEISTVEKVYPVIYTDFSMSEQTIEPDKEYSGVLTIKNIGSADIKGLFVNFTSSDDIIISNGTGSRYFENIPVNTSKQITVKFRTMKQISSVRQSISAALKYTYAMGSEELEGSYESSFVMFGSMEQETSPLPVITSEPFDAPLEAGRKYRKAFYVINKGTADMKNISVNIKGSEGLTITDGRDQFFVDTIKAGEQKRFLVYFDTNAELTAVSQTLIVDLEYYYDKNGTATPETKSGTISMTSSVSSAPVLRISGEKLESALVPDSEYEYTISVKNYGDITVRDVFVDFTGTDALYFLDGTESGYIDIIRPQDEAKIVVKFRTLEDITSVKQGITAEMKYSYGRNSSIMQTNGTSSVVLIAAANKSADGRDNNAAPNIIIGKYETGADQIAAGEVFDLALDFYNTSADTSIENVVMTINASGDLSIYGGSSSFYYPNISAAGAESESIQLRALPTAMTGTSSVSVSFKYDYVTGDTRNTVTSEQTLYIPLYQPDKMTFSVNQPTYDIYAGNEVYVTLTYLNKGRADAANVKAELVGDVSALTTEKVIGNVAAGGNGSVDFIVTPYMSGEVSFSIVLTYEDSNMNEVTKEIPVTLYVMEMEWGGDDMYFPMTMEDSGEAEGGFPWWIVFVGGGVLLVAAVVVIIVVVRKKKKKGKKLTADDIDWEDEFDEDNSDDKTKV